MKVYKGSKLIASKVRDCTGFMSAIGLRFKKTFKPYDAYWIHLVPDAVLDSFFVPIDFIAVWLDEEYKVLRAEYCTPWKYYLPVKKQRYVLELPAAKKGLLKKGGVLRIKA